jgi:hypothetical protein
MGGYLKCQGLVVNHTGLNNEADQVIGGPRY